jgi:hypothetical protein
MRIAVPLLLIWIALAPAAACGPDRLQKTVVARIGAGGDILLADGRTLRLIGLRAVEPASLPLRPGDAVAYGAMSAPDRWGRLPSIVFALPDGGEPVFLQSWMASTGRALIRHEGALGDCWKLLQTAEGQAKDHPATLAEPGRFARIEGRVLRVGEGRTAHFITVEDQPGARMTAMIQKRNLARLARGGVDLQALKGHIVRLRGVRSLRNPRIIAVTRAEQIEIVR